MAFNRIEPIGDYRQDYNSAAIQAMIVNVAQAITPREKGSSVKQTVPADYMPKWYVDIDRRTNIEQKRQSLAQMREVLLGWAKPKDKKKDNSKKVKR